MVQAPTRLHASDPAPGVLEAEAILTGTVMLVPIAEVLAVGRIAAPQDFWGSCQDIYGACLDLARAGVEPSVPVVCGELERRRGLEDIGGEPRIVALAFAESAFVYANPGAMEAMARFIHEDAQRRRGVSDIEAAARRIQNGKRPSGWVTPGSAE